MAIYENGNNGIGVIRFDDNTILEVGQPGGGGSGVGGPEGLYAKNLVTGEETLPSNPVISSAEIHILNNTEDTIYWSSVYNETIALIRESIEPGQTTTLTLMLTIRSLGDEWYTPFTIDNEYSYDIVNEQIPQRIPGEYGYDGTIHWGSYALPQQFATNIIVNPSQ